MNTCAAVFTQNGFSMNYKLFYPEKTEGQGHNGAIDYAYRHGGVIDRLLSPRARRAQHQGLSAPEPIS